MVQDCTLKLVGQLEFDFYYGGCANVENRMLYLCFNNGLTDNQNCRYSDNPLGVFQQSSESNHDHRFIRIAADKCKFYVLYQDCKVLFVV